MLNNTFSYTELAFAFVPQKDSHHVHDISQMSYLCMLYELYELCKLDEFFYESHKLLEITRICFKYIFCFQNFFWNVYGWKITQKIT